MDALLQRLDRIEAKLDTVLNGPKSDLVNVREAQLLTGCPSVQSQFKWFRTRKVKPYRRGRYRRLEITNQLALEAMKLRSPKPSLVIQSQTQPT